MTDPDVELDFGDDEELVKQFSVDGDKGVCSRLPDSVDLEGIMHRALVRSLFTSMFNAPITADTLDAYMSYAKRVAACLLAPAFHKMTFGQVLSDFEEVRARIAKGILETDAGKRISKAAAEAAAAGNLPNENAEDASGYSMISQIADGSALAFVGNHHLATHALQRLKSEPERYLPLWKRSPVDFLHEQARVDPPVSAVTGVLGEEKSIELVEAGNVTFPPGTTRQLVISTANMDPSVFGGPHHSKKYATVFDPSRSHDEILSWNGRLADVKEFKAPRGCPGYRLSMGLAKSLVSVFLPASEALPVPLKGSAAKSYPHLDAAEQSGKSITELGKHAWEHQTRQSNLDRCGFFLWMVCCLMSLGWLFGRRSHGDGHLGAMSTRYTLYLASQAGVSAGFLFENDLLQWQCTLLAAMAYYLMYITSVFQGHYARGYLFSLWAWFVYGLLAIQTTAALVFFGSVPTLLIVTRMFYFVACLFGFLTVYQYWAKARKEHETYDSAASKGRLDAAKSGMIGGCTALACLPLKWVFPVYGTFICCVINSLVYVPFMLPCLKAMDKDFNDIDVVVPNLKMIEVSISFFTVVFALVAAGSGYAMSVATSSDLCRFEDPATLPSNTSICTSSPMSQVDSYGRLMFFVAKNLVTIPPEEVANRESALSIQLPKYDTILPRKEAIIATNWEIPTEDEDVEENSWMQDLAKQLFLDKFLRSPLLFPMHDNPTRWENLEEARQIMKIASGKFLPEPVIDWSNIAYDSDEAVSAMCFAGMAAVRVKKLSPEQLAVETDNATYMVDFSEMVHLETRPGYEQFGATAFFNTSQNLVRIRWTEYALNVRPGDRHWKHAKWVFKCSALVGITANEHLMGQHLIFANLMTSSDRQNLPKNHPIRRLLKPFTHKTPTVNMGAQSFLTTEYGLLHRAASLDFKGVRDAFLLAMTTNRYSSYDKAIEDPEGQVAMLKELGEERFPFAADALDFYKVIHKFVDGYLKTYYPNDEDIRNDQYFLNFYAGFRVFEDNSLPPPNAITTKEFINQVAAFIFTVTGKHHVVGNLAEYLISPDFTSCRLRPGTEISDVEASHYGLLVAILTGMKAPKLMNNFEHLLLDDAHRPKTAKVFAEFQNDLAELCKVIDERNAKRKWVFHGFHPARLLSSVSI
eukprot:CAMPEP_0181288858 /NCGR_PEP_ID=MMETSP1101-20121128/566_1 /TAXON_ID=46948 /ORGANISM="Rhodomonas abbreviata, Strain Caron Lab Isolate" /LENGTH=1147 /DNA_ID=CAMNT_0023393027 /DNA_START=146 /DNA_END=3589 /DNA_ORIENTATION=+